MRALNRSGCWFLSLIKEKSWSVKIVNGYVLNNQVRSDLCKDCAATPTLVVGNYGDPDLLLYGCNGHKCKHVLIRMKFSDADQTAFTQIPVAVSSSVADFQEIAPTARFGSNHNFLLPWSCMPSCNHKTLKEDSFCSRIGLGSVGTALVVRHLMHLP